MVGFQGIILRCKSDIKSQNVQRVLLVGLSLCLLHCLGILVSLYYLITRLIEPDEPDKPIGHVCTSAIFCPFFRILTGVGGVAVQIVGSILGLMINVVLLLGVFKADTRGLIIWLASYSAAIIGCLFLFGVVLRVLAVRDETEEDVSRSTFVISLIPLVLALLYLLCWILVYRLWKKMRQREKKMIMVNE